VRPETGVRVQLYLCPVEKIPVPLNSCFRRTTPDAVEAQFTDGNGYLIVTHPYCEPMRIAYDIAAHTATPTNITLQIRDFEGAINDPMRLILDHSLCCFG